MPIVDNAPTAIATVSAANQLQIQGTRAVPTGVWTTIFNWSLVNGAGLGLDLANGIFTIQQDGAYTVYGSTWFANVSTVGSRSLRFRVPTHVSGDSVAGQNTTVATATGGSGTRVPMAITFTAIMRAGDVIEFQAWHDSGVGNMTVGTQTGLRTNLTILPVFLI